MTVKVGVGGVAGVTGAVVGVDGEAQDVRTKKSIESAIKARVFISLILPLFILKSRFYKPAGEDVYHLAGGILQDIKPVERGHMQLLEAQNGIWMRVLRIEGDHAFQNRLMQHGLYPGDRVRVLRSAPLGGPLLVEVNGREIAIGRGVAENIFIKDVE